MSLRLVLGKSAVALVASLLPAPLPGLPETVAGATREQQHAAALWLQQQNSGRLTQLFGRAPTQAEERMAWHFGADGAHKLLTMPPETPFASVPNGVMGADTATVLAQNPHLRNQTIGGLHGQYQARFNGGAPTAAPRAPQQTGQISAMPSATGTGGATSPTAPVRVTTPEQFAALPDGAIAIAPDGRLIVKGQQKPPTAAPTPGVDLGSVRF